MGQADFSHGQPLMVDYTPGAAVVAGQVVVLAEIPFVAHSPIDASRLGALAAGGGVYEGTSDGTVDNPGVKVYWNDTADKFTTTASGNKRFGWSLPSQGASADGDKIKVIHDPGD